MNALERPPVAPGLSAGRPTPKEPRLPPLREDLRLHEGPDADDGSPTWVLEDPACDQFFQLGVLQAECLKRWHLGTAKAVAAAVGRETLLRPTAETVENFAKFLMRMSLTREAGTSARLAEQMKRKPKQTLWKFFLRHYLFFRIPLVAPDAFLRRTLPWVERLFFTKTFLWATLTALVLALYLIGRQWDAFTHTFSHFFSWEGAVMAGLTIACTKVIHELAHAYTAEHFGCRIPGHRLHGDDAAPIYRYVRCLAPEVQASAHGRLRGGCFGGIGFRRMGSARVELSARRRAKERGLYARYHNLDHDARHQFKPLHAV